MPPWIMATSLGLVAGISVPLGAVAGFLESIKPDWLETELRHTLIAFGGGALFSAVALVLVPEGMRGLPAWLIAGSFALGGLGFLGIDRLLQTRDTSASQLVAMLADFVPEALALGAAIGSRSAAAPLLALLIALQNLPESFNAYRELSASTKLPARRILITLSGTALLGPGAALAGYFWLSSFPLAVSVVMLFAAGGILYLVFEDIAPQARLERRWAPPLGAVAGFLMGMLGQVVLQGT